MFSRHHCQPCANKKNLSPLPSPLLLLHSLLPCSSTGFVSHDTLGFFSFAVNTRLGKSLLGCLEAHGTRWSSPSPVSPQVSATTRPTPVLFWASQRPHLHHAHEAFTPLDRVVAFDWPLSVGFCAWYAFQLLVFLVMPLLSSVSLSSCPSILASDLSVPLYYAPIADSPTLQSATYEVRSIFALFLFSSFEDSRCLPRSFANHPLFSYRSKHLTFLAKSTIMPFLRLNGTMVRLEGWKVHYLSKHLFSSPISKTLVCFRDRALPSPRIGAINALSWARSNLLSHRRRYTRRLVPFGPLPCTTFLTALFCLPPGSDS